MEATISVTPNEVVLYGSVNMPEADAATVGGAVDFSKRVAWYDLSANDTIDAVSSSASDNAVRLLILARDPTGAVQSPAFVTLNGQTPIVSIGGFTAERLLAAVITGGAVAGLVNPGGTAAVGDIAVYRHTPLINAHTAQTGSANTTGTTPPLFKMQSGDGAAVAIGQVIRTTSGTGANQIRQIVAITGYGTDVVAVSRDWAVLPDTSTVYSVLQGMCFEILPNPVKAITRAFATSSADIPGGSTRIYYEKIFVVNNDTTTALTAAQIEIVADTPSLPGGASLDIALTTSLNDTNTITNRQTTPSVGVGSFIIQPAFVNVPGSGNLTSGAAPNSGGAQGIWLRLTLPAGTAAYKGGAGFRVQGTTT